MASTRKIIAAASVAYQKHVEASAAVVVARIDGSPNVAALQRRASAYEAQWLAAERRAELTQDRMDAL